MSLDSILQVKFLLNYDKRKNKLQPKLSQNYPEIFLNFFSYSASLH